MVKDKYGNILFENEYSSNRWKEYFEEFGQGS